MWWHLSIERGFGSVDKNGVVVDYQLVVVYTNTITIYEFYTCKCKAKRVIRSATRFSTTELFNFQGLIHICCLVGSTVYVDNH